MNDRFIYDENSSTLYAPDGRYLKRVFCPKAKTWNQLLADDPTDRMRGCSTCHERVLNLDVASIPDAVAQLLQRGDQACVYASKAAGRVIFLKGPTSPAPLAAGWTATSGEIVIKTARGLEDINRAAALGFWPDVRLIEFDTGSIRNKFQLLQHSGTGRIQIQGDYRDALHAPSPPVVDEVGGRQVLGRWTVAIPFTDYYSDYQTGLPIAAYLIPPEITGDTEVVVEDPIEDRVGARWNQGSAYRATHVPGRIQNRRVVIDARSGEVISVVG